MIALFFFIICIYRYCRSIYWFFCVKLSVCLYVYNIYMKFEVFFRLYSFLLRMYKMVLCVDEVWWIYRSFCKSVVKFIRLYLFCGLYI